MRVRSRVVVLRRERGMTVDALAERSGVPRSTVDKWGREGVPVAVAHAVRIADALGVEVRDLVRVPPAPEGARGR